MGKERWRRSQEPQVWEGSVALGLPWASASSPYKECRTHLAALWGLGALMFYGPRCCPQSPPPPPANLSHLPHCQPSTANVKPSPPMPVNLLIAYPDLVSVIHAPGEEKEHSEPLPQGVHIRNHLTLPWQPLAWIYHLLPKPREKRKLQACAVHPPGGGLLEPHMEGLGPSPPPTSTGAVWIGRWVLMGCSQTWLEAPTEGGGAGGGQERKRGQEQRAVGVRMQAVGWGSL